MKLNTAIAIAVAAAFAAPFAAQASAEGDRIILAQTSGKITTDPKDSNPAAPPATTGTPRSAPSTTTTAPAEAGATSRGGFSALDKNGVPNFSALQAALSEGRSQDLVFFAFDAMFAEGEDLRGLTLIERKERLQALLSGLKDKKQLIRYVGSQLIMLGINYRWNVRLTDSQNGFRAIRRDAGRKLGLTSNLTTIEQEMLMKALKQGYRVSEIPSHEYERKWGTSKVVVWKLWFSYVWSFFRNII